MNVHLHARKRGQSVEQIKRMNAALFLSLLFHGGVVTVGMTGPEIVRQINFHIRLLY